jgi:hypothetical protein
MTLLSAIAIILLRAWRRCRRAPLKSVLIAAMTTWLAIGVLSSTPGWRACADATAEVAKPVLSPAKPQRPISLRDRLITGLKARLKSEVAFVDKVVLRVHTGQLPQRMVDQTFFWARDRASVDRNGRTQRPIIYFQPAMAARAKRLNVSL